MIDIPPSRGAKSFPFTSDDPTVCTLLVGILAWSSVLLVGSLVIRASEAVNAALNPDEFQYLHSAWMVEHGYLPYRDFWTNRAPPFFSLLRPLVAYFDEDPSTVFLVVRLLMWVINLGLFGLVAALAAQKRSWPAGLFAALLLSVNLTVFKPTVDIRHDSLTLICELTALGLLARGMVSSRSRDILAAGASLGLALALSPKGLFGLSGLILGYFVHQVSAPPRAIRPAAHLRSLLLLLGGSLGVFGLVIVSLLPTEVWPLMLTRVFLESFTTPDRFSPIGWLRYFIMAEPVIWLVMLSGFGVAARQWWNGSTRRHPRETLLLLAGLWHGTCLFLMASAYQQSALPLLAVLSIFGGRLLAMGAGYVADATSRAKAVARAIGLTVVVSWITIGSVWWIFRELPPFQRRNAEAVRMIQYVLSLTGPKDAILDGQSAYIFRPQASYYGSLVESTLIRFRRGELAFDIPERCERLVCKIVILDYRVLRLPRGVLAWIAANYTPSPVFPYVLLQRSVVSPPERPDGQESRNGRNVGKMK